MKFMIPIQKNRNTLSEDSVSPVIGVILMVAITVILAAIIATFVFGMTQNISKTRAVTGTISLADAKTLVVTYHGGGDQLTCVGVRWDITRSDGSPITSYQMGTTLASGSILNVGLSKTLITNFAGKKHIIATAYFTDNTQQIILDTFIG